MFQIGLEEMKKYSELKKYGYKFEYDFDQKVIRMKNHSGKLIVEMIGQEDKVLVMDQSSFSWAKEILDINMFWSETRQQEGVIILTFQDLNGVERKTLLDTILIF